MPAVRAIFLAHRYLGIGVGVLMALWCLSGIVMIYVPYPRLSEAERINALPPIDWSLCCIFPSHVPSSTSISEFQLEMLGAVPVLRLALADGSFGLTNLTNGREMGPVSVRDAWAAAARLGTSRGFGMRAATQESIDHDQWTVGGFHQDRPLHHVSFGDSKGTEIYVSSRSGKVVQLTTQPQRFWSWLGAVPHWLYPSVLRRHPQTWAQVVIWASLFGSFLTLTGLYIGVRQLRCRDGALSSPYRGIKFIHHVPGLVFGLFAMTWVVSGLLSMNPWGVLETEGMAEDRGALAGALPTLGEIKTLLDTIPRNSPRNVVSIRSAVLGGRLFAIGTAADGSRRRFNVDGQAAPLTAREIDDLAYRLATPAPVAWTRMSTADAYHYSVGDEQAQLPAIRIVAKGTSRTLYYLDAVTGELIDKADASGRSYRWWHSGLHRLDLTPGLRTTAARTLVMLPLLLGAAVVCVTGAYLGVRRLTR